MGKVKGGIWEIWETCCESCIMMAIVSGIRRVGDLPINLIEKLGEHPV